MSDESTATEQSFGILPVAAKEGALFLFCIQNYSGAWLLPKGHAEPGETPQEAAARELTEETGLVVDQWIDLPPFGEEYSFVRGGRRIDKQVVYFPAHVSGTVTLQKKEVRDGHWVALSEAYRWVSFPEIQHITKQLAERMGSAHEAPPAGSPGPEGHRLAPHPET